MIAEDRALSMQLAAETMIAEIARILRPGGRVLACVDSLVLGMAVLADQHHWAQLVDLPHAEVVLVPWPDGTITRCYGPDQARELFSGAGLTVDWIRPRTVFSESMVTHLLRRDPRSLPKLVQAELAAARRRVTRGPAGDIGRQTADAAAVAAAGGGGLPPPLGVRGLAAHAAGRFGPRVEPARRNLLPAVHALAVGVFLDAGERGEHLFSLGAGGGQDRLRPVGLRQRGSRVGRVLGVPHPGLRPRMLAVQDGYRPVQLVAHLLQALTGNGNLH